MILMQLDGVGGIAVIAYQIVCAGIATVKLGSRAASTLSPVNPPPNNPQRSGPEVGKWCPARAGLHFQLRNVFFRSDTEVAVNPLAVRLLCTVATLLQVISTAAALPVASFILPDKARA
ncbi:hypothetical protein ECZU34_00130 [Escherichia coli]|nr:hypothetical protein ECZU34_00130 [Escherichia coli]